MNKKFLSRGKREDNGEWITGYYVKIPNPTDKLNKELHIIFELDGQANYVIPETASRCAGITDKNNVLIFEGDVVKSIWRHLGDTDTATGIVKYDNAAFFLETNDHYLYFEENIFSIECEVIGNIHDSPQMLGRADMPVSNDVFQPVLQPTTPENFEISPA